MALERQKPKLVTGDAKKWVDNLIETRTSEGRPRMEMIHGMRRQRFMRLKNRPPEAYQQYVGEGVKVPITYRLIETVLGAVGGGGAPTWFFSSPDPELARRGARWAALAIQSQERVSQAGMYWRYWDSLAADGMACIKTQRFPWTDFPRQAENESDAVYGKRTGDFLKQMPEVPWRSRAVDCATFFPPLYEWGPNWIVESAMRSSWQALGELGLRPGGSGNLRFAGDDEPINVDMMSTRVPPQMRVDEVWTDDTLFVRIMGRVYEYANDLGQIPYVWTNGSTIPFADPTLQALSVAFPLQYIEPWVNQQLSVLVGAANAASTPTPVTTHQLIPGAPPDAAAQVTITDWQGGRHYDLPAGTDLKFVAPPLDINAINLLNNMVEIAERFTLSASPSFAGSRTAGTVIAAVAERTFAVLKPRVEMAERTWGDLMKSYLHLVRNVVKAPVVVSGLVFEERTGRKRMAETALSPRDVPKISDVIAEIKFQTTQDRIAWDAHNVMMTRSGIWTKERARRESGVEDPQQEALDVSLEQLMESPQVQIYIMMRAMEGVEPLESLQELFADAGGEGALQKANFAEGASQNGNVRAGPGRLEGEPRNPGGERIASAAQGRNTPQ